ncbi:hypothetical protein GCM10010411_44630 [Actinomadura fulvescens]|uniref:Uncharacterized protein n=1 Tax=Actinomadura fulvescens TaxID=46160 RepID=A0ABP6CC23_9ACTN
MSSPRCGGTLSAAPRACGTHTVCGRSLRRIGDESARGAPDQLDPPQRMRPCPVRTIERAIPPCFTEMTLENNALSKSE